MRAMGTIDERLAHALGSAHAGLAAVRVARSLAGDAVIEEALAQIEEDERELARRCEAVVSARGDDAAPVLRVARAATRTAATMMGGYLGATPSAPIALEFLCLAKAGEVGRWVLLGAIADGVGETDVAALARWALPLLQRHLAVARHCAEEHPDPVGARTLI